MRLRDMLLLCIGLSLLLVGDASAKRKKDKIKDALRAAGPAASAADIPALAKLLDKAGWTPTPELSGAFQAGVIFQPTDVGHRTALGDCFDVEPTVRTYTSAEVVTQLQVGVSVPVGVVDVSASGALVKKMKFGTPSHVLIPRLDLMPTDVCRAKLERAKSSGMDISTWYVIQEVLLALIAEQTCGRIDARGRIVGLGAADAEFAKACAQESLDPVAVAYRTVPLSELVPGLAVAAVPVVDHPDGAAGKPRKRSVAGSIGKLLGFGLVKDAITDLNDSVESMEVDSERPSTPSSTSPEVPETAPAKASVDFGSSGTGHNIDAKLRQQECEQAAQRDGAKAREARLAAKVSEAQAKARTAWQAQGGELKRCTELKRAERGDCIAAVEKWLSVAKAMQVKLPAGVEPVETDCGTRQPAFEAATQTVAATDVAAAKALLDQLKAADTLVGRAGPRPWPDSNATGAQREEHQKNWKACKAGDGKGCSYLGLMYEQGLGVTQSTTRAFELYTKACDGGDAQGCFGLGTMYNHWVFVPGGHIVAKNMKTARAYYKKACDLGYETGCHWMKK